MAFADITLRKDSSSKIDRYSITIRYNDARVMKDWIAASDLSSALALVFGSICNGDGLGKKILDTLGWSGVESSIQRVSSGVYRIFGAVNDHSGRQLYFDGKPVEVSVTDLEKRLIQVLLDGSNGGDFELSNTDVALFEIDPDTYVFGCDFERIENIVWNDREQLGALITSLQKKCVLSVEEDPHDGNGIWFCCDVLKMLAA